MASVDLSSLDASLKHRKSKGNGLLVKQLTDGWGQLKKFRKMRVLDRVVLGSLTVNSILQPGAKGTFNPKANAIKAAARIGQVRPAKIDLLITEIERLELEANYFAEVEGTDGRDPNKFMFADYIHEWVVKKAGEDTINAVWMGDHNAAGTTPLDVCDGIHTLVQADILSDEMPEELVLTHSVAGFYIQESNVIAELKALVKKFKTKLPAYAYEKATLYCAPERIAEYEFALEAANGQVNTYDKFNQVVLYFAKNITMQPVLSLAGTDFMLITPDDNIVYLTDRKQDSTELDHDYSKRDRSIALVADYWFAPNYVRADIMVTNDLGERPEEAGE